MLKQYIQIYCSYPQDNWVTLLLIAKFAYNNVPNASTGITPFFANKGYHLNITVHPEYQLTSNTACDFVVFLDKLHMILHNEIACAQTYYKEQVNKS